MLLIAKKGTAKFAANNNAQNNHDLLLIAWGILISAFINAYVAAKVSSQIRILCGIPNVVTIIDPIRKCTNRKSSEFWPKS